MHAAENITQNLCGLNRNTTIPHRRPDSGGRDMDMVGRPHLDKSPQKRADNERALRVRQAPDLYGRGASCDSLGRLSPEHMAGSMDRNRPLFRVQEILARRRSRLVEDVWRRLGRLPPQRHNPLAVKNQRRERGMKRGGA